MRRAHWYLPVLLWIAPALLPAQQVAFGSYAIPSNSGNPCGIVAGPDGAMWFTENDNGRIGRISMSGSITEFNGGGGPDGITVGPDGALWFTETQSNAIGRITTDGAVTHFPIPVPNSFPANIVTGRDGHLWFTETNVNRIGRISTTGVVREFPLPATHSGPLGIAAGPDGAIWFTEATAQKIGRISLTGTITEYDAGVVGLAAITAGPDGALWFAGYGMVGRINTHGAITKYPLQPFAPYNGITTGPDGALWFTSYNDGPNTIGRITTSGSVIEYPLPIAPKIVWAPFWIAPGPRGTLWFTLNFLTYGIGQVFFPTANLNVSPAAASFKTTLTFTGSGFAPGETVDIYTGGVGSTVLARATSDLDGSFTTTALEPESPYGPRLYVSTGQSSGLLGAANSSVTPILLLTPKSGPPGTTISISGYGYPSFGRADLYWSNPRTPMGSVVMDFRGAFSGYTVAVPANTSPVAHSISGVDELTGATGGGKFTVE